MAGIPLSKSPAFQGMLASAADAAGRADEAAAAVQQIGQQVQADAAAVIGSLPAAIDARIEQAIESISPAIEAVATPVAEAAGTAAGKIEAERVAAGVESRTLAYSDAALEIIRDLIGGDGKVPTYTDPIMGVTLTDQPTIILPEDPYRIGAIVQSEGVDIAIGQGDATPNFSGQYHIIYAGAGVDSSILQRKPIYAVARWPIGSEQDLMDPKPAINVGVALTVERLTAGDLPQITLGDRVTSYWPDPVHADFRTAVRTAVNNLQSAGIYAKLGFLRITGASLANDAINLADPSGPQTILRNVGTGSGALVHTPYLAVASDGVAYLDTQISPAAGKMAFDNHAMIVFPSSSAPAQSNEYYSMGAGLSMSLQAGRTATIAGYRSGGVLRQRTVSPALPISLSRLSADGYTQYIDGADPLDIVETADASIVATRTVTLSAINGATGPSRVSNKPYRVYAFGAGLTGNEMLTLRNAIRAVLDVADSIRGDA